MRDRGESVGPTIPRLARRAATALGQAARAVWRVRLAVTLGILLGVLAAETLIGRPAPRHRSWIDVIAPQGPEAPGSAEARGHRAEELRVLTSPAVLAPALASVQGGEPDAAALAALAARVEGRWQGLSDRLRILVEAGTPARAGALARAIAASYVEQWDRRRAAAEGWLADRVARLEAEAERAAARAEAFSAEHGALGPEALRLRAGQLAQLRERAAVLEAAIAEAAAPARAARAARDALLFSRVAEILADPALDRLAGEVLSAAPGAALPQAAMARFDAAMERAIARREAGQAALMDERATLAAMIAEWERDFARETALAEDLAALEAAAAERRRTHRAVAAQLAARRDAARAIAPRVPGGPSAPVRLPSEGRAPALDMALAGLAGGLLSGLVALGLGRARPVSARLIARRTGLEVVATVPEVPAWPAGTPFRPGVERPDGAFAGGILALRAGLLLLSGEVPPRVVALTGAAAGGRRPAIAHALAQAARAQGRRTVLVGCDGASEAAPGIRGLFSVLCGEAAYHEALQIDRRTGLHLVPAEAGGIGIDTLAGSARFAELMAILRRTYDLVILDLPPAWEAPWLSAVLGPQDALLCLLPGETRVAEPVLGALARLRRLDLRAVGVVLHLPAAVQAPAAEPAADTPPQPAPAATPSAAAGAGSNVLYVVRSAGDAR